VLIRCSSRRYQRGNFLELRTFSSWAMMGDTTTASTMTIVTTAMSKSISPLSETEASKNYAIVLEWGNCVISAVWLSSGNKSRRLPKSRIVPYIKTSSRFTTTHLHACIQYNIEKQQGQYIPFFFDKPCYIRYARCIHKIHRLKKSPVL